VRACLVIASVLRSDGTRRAESGERGAGRGGRIINTTSGTGLFGTVGQADYGAAKAGIVSLTTITATGVGGQAAGASPAPARSQPRRPAGPVLGRRSGAARAARSAWDGSACCAWRSRAPAVAGSMLSV